MADLAVRYGVAGPALCRAHELGLPCAALSDVVERIALQNHLLIRATADVARACDAIGKRGVVLKGFVRVLAGQGWAATRYCEDVDVLVEPRAGPELEGYLASAGWTVHHRLTPSGRRRRPHRGRWGARHEAGSCVSPDGGVVDLHARMFGQQGWSASDFEALWARADPLDGARGLRRASVDDVLVQLSHHVMRDVRHTERLLPRHLADVAEIVEAGVPLSARATSDRWVQRSIAWWERARTAATLARLGPWLFEEGSPWAMARKVVGVCQGVAAVGVSAVVEPRELFRAMVPTRGYLDQVVRGCEAEPYRRLWWERARRAVVRRYSQ